MPSCSAPLVSIVIPVHNQLEYTRACLASIAACPPPVEYEVVVVDDGSTDGTAQFLADICGKDNHVRFVRNAASLGFAGACNRGAKAALGSIILFLNNDTQVQPGWFPPLLENLTNCSDIGIVAPKLIFTNRTIQHCGKVWSDPALPNSHPHHIYYKFPAGHPAVTRSRDFQLVTGACIMVRANEFRELGGFDEGYENGWEDDDLCYKYTSSGKRIFYCAESVIIHHQNKTLNERMYELERRLPPYARLRELDRCLVKGSVAEEEVSLARHVQETFQAMETELLRFREKFHKNRNRFFSKWGAMIRRDDYLYCNSDNVPLGEALKDVASISSPVPKPTSTGASLGKEDVPRVSIVILTINRLDVTKECVASIRRHTPEPHEVIFVDNGSTDGTVDWLRELAAAQTNVRLFANGANLGFSKGCNQGIESSRGDYILLLNNDTVVTPGWLSGLLECFSAENVGIVGPMTDNISGIQQWPWNSSLGKEDLDRFAGEFRARYRHRRIPVRRIVGFCMLFRRELVSNIGMLDEQFGSGNFEDDDYCLRSAIEGYTNLIAGDVFIRHVGSASFIGNRINYGEALLANQSLFTRKWSRPVTDEVTAKKIIRLKTQEKAELLFRRGYTNEAVEVILQEGIRQIPEEPGFYQLLAEIFLDADMPKDALDVLRESPAQNGRTANLTARALLLQGRTADARHLVDELLRSEKETPELQALSGEVWHASGELHAAGDAFERALTADAGCVRAYKGLASLAAGAGDRELALALLERATVIVPADGAATSEFYALATEMGAFARAEQLLAEGRHFYPNDARLAYFHIDVLLRQEKFEAALAIIEQALVQFKIREGFMDAACTVRSRIGPLKVALDRFELGVAVSLCMIVRDEEKNLPRCLASLKPLVDEIIIADTGSTDRTREIAEVFGAVVIDVPWTGDYSAARNASLEKAAGNWILAMDADEVISPLDHDRFRAIVAASAKQLVAHTILTRNYTNKVDLENWQENRGEYPNEEAGRGWMPSDKVRLFPNSPKIRFENPIHEMVEPSLARLGIPDPRADVIVHHYGYLDESRQQQKKEFYYELGKKKLDESLGSPTAICELAIQAAGIGRYDEAIELWHRALRHDAQSYLAHFNLGYAYLQKGMFQAGKDASFRAMGLRANYREAIINYAICELCLGNDVAAMRVISDAIPLNKNYPTLQLMRGVINASRGRGEAALEDFTGLRDSNVEFSQFIHETVVKLLHAGQHEFVVGLVRTAALGGFCMPDTIRLLEAATGTKESP